MIYGWPCPTCAGEGIEEVEHEEDPATAVAVTGSPSNGWCRSTGSVAAALLAAAVGLRGAALLAATPVALVVVALNGAALLAGGGAV